MAQVRIEDPSGTERATIPLVELAKEQSLDATTQARITVNRDDLNDVDGLTPGTDRVYVEEGGVDTFGGVLRTPGRSGGKPTMLVDSFAEYMRRSEPVALGEEKVAVDDSTLIQECIDATPQLTAGTIETIAAGETWIFSGVSQLEKAAKVAQAAGGELDFAPDLTVDYVDPIGSDKTATTLSPANQSFVENTFVVQKDGTAGNTTHLKVYGVGQGTAQVEATVVPDADSGSYTNKVTYTHPTWTSGDDEVWDSRTNKDLKNVSALQTWGLTLIEALQDPEIRVRCIVKGETVELGDTFHVTHPDEDVDDDLRAVEVTQLIGANGGTRYETVFSNYSVGHYDPLAEDHRDVGRYNLAFEGDLTNVQQAPGRGPVGPSHDYYIYVYYPDDVVHETNATILVKGTNYRAFSQGAAAGGTNDDTTASGAPDSDNATMDFVRSTSSALLQLTVPTVSGSATIVIAYASLQNTGGTANTLALDIDNISTGTSIYNGGLESYDPNDMRFFEGVQTGSNLEGDTIEFSVSNTDGDEALLSAGVMAIADHTHTFDWQHTHVPDPGILDWDGSDQSPAHYPENVDVIVNGSSQGTALGDGTGEFEEVVDVAGALSSGWNTIRLTSDGLGHLDASFSADLFRQSL